MSRDDIIRMAREAGVGRWDAQEVAIERFAALVAAAERERAIGIVKGMQEELQAKFEQSYMQGVIAGAEAEREACAQTVDHILKEGGGSYGDAIRARSQA